MRALLALSISFLVCGCFEDTAQNHVPLKLVYEENLPTTLDFSALPVETEKQKTQAVEVRKIIEGGVVEPGAEIRINRKCTATLIGRQVILTAAHCAPIRGPSKIGDKKINCMRADYKLFDPKKEPRNPSTIGQPDYALCRLDEPLHNVLAERINISPDFVKEGDAVWLSGFGCIKPQQADDPPVVTEGSKLTSGLSQVQKLPVGERNNMILKGGIILCGGDSGGPAYRKLPNGSRVIVGVNSERWRCDENRPGYLDNWCSHISSTSTPDAISFFQKWSEENEDVKICGLHPEAEGCRPLTKF